MIEHAKQRFEELKASGLLPSPKGVVLAVLELTQSNDVSIQSLTHLVQTDPAMAGRVLKYANAAHGGSLRHLATLASAHRGLPPAAAPCGAAVYALCR